MPIPFLVRRFALFFLCGCAAAPELLLAQMQFPRMVSGNLLEAAGADLGLSDTAVDSEGRLYVTGSVRGDAATIPSATYRKAGSKQDIFIARYNAAGTVLEYFAIIGGADDDLPAAIAVDSEFRAVVVGTTKSADFPGVPNGFPGGPGGEEDGFVLRLSAAGDQILGAARFGGSGSDLANALALDASGAVYVAGNTKSSDFPTTAGAYDQTYDGDQDGFVIKIDLTNASVVWSTFLGGPTPDELNSIVLDGQGAPIVAGASGRAYEETHTDPGLPVSPNSFGRPYAGGRDAILFKLSAAGSAVEFGGYLGGSESDRARTVLRNDSGEFVIIGETDSVFSIRNIGLLTYFPRVPAPTPDEETRYFYRGAVFIARISGDGSQLELSKTPNIGSSFPVDATLGGSGEIFVAALNAGGSPPAFPGDLIQNPDVGLWWGASFIAAFSPDDLSVLSGTRPFPVAGAVLRSVSAGTVGEVHLGVEAIGNNVPLGPATATAMPGAPAIVSASAYLMAVRFDNDAPCEVSMAGLPGELQPAGGSGTVTISAQPGCPWGLWTEPSVGGDGGIQLGFPVAGFGDRSVNFSYPANNGDWTRFVSVYSSTESYYWDQLSTGCASPEFQPGALAFPAAGGTMSVAVRLPGGCPGGAVADQPWVTFEAGNTGAGSFLGTVSAAPNPDQPRAATVRFGDSELSVLQQSAAGCGLVAPLASRRVGRHGGTVFVVFQLQGTNCVWHAASTASWARIVGGAAGQGSVGTVQLLVEPFSAQAIRTAKVIVNGSELSLEQLGFDDTLPAEVRAVSNAATYSVYDLAGGGLASVFGNQLAVHVAQAEAIPLPTTLGGIRLILKFSNGVEVAAPLLYVSPRQINFQIPEGVVGAMDVRVEAPGRGSNTYTADVLAISPRLFEVRDGGRTITAAGYAQLVYPDGSQKLTFLDQCGPLGDCYASGVDRGPVGSELYIVLFGTGFPADATLEEYAGPASQPLFEITYAGRHPDFVGLQQVNIRIPREAEIVGSADIDVTVRGEKTQSVRIFFHSLN